MTKRLMMPLILTSVILVVYLYKDARTLDIAKSKLPINEQLAVTISQRYLAGGWTNPGRLHLRPYSMKSVKETSSTFIVNLVDEGDTSFCKGYRVTVQKSTANVLEKDSINYCS